VTFGVIMSLFKSVANLLHKEKDEPPSKRPEIGLVDIGEPLARIVRENNNKAFQEYQKEHKGRNDSSFA
jgi:hypothetical protein